MNRRTKGIILMLPAILLIGILMVYPIGYSCWLSLYSKHTIYRTQRFIGLDNYAETFVDNEFWKALQRGTAFAAGSVSLQLLLGLGVALFLNRRFAGRNVIRGIVLFPYIIPTVLAVLIWKWILDELHGVGNFLLISSGITTRPIAWLAPQSLLLTTAFVATWRFFPFVVIGLLARLQTVPPELADAAKVDGASRWQEFYHVTLPQLREILFVILLLRTIWMFIKFDVVWLMAGAPLKFIRTLPIYAFMRTFDYLQAGRGAALTVIMFLMLVGVALAYFKLFRPGDK